MKWSDKMCHWGENIIIKSKHSHTYWLIYLFLHSLIHSFDSLICVNWWSWTLNLERTDKGSGGCSSLLYCSHLLTESVNLQHGVNISLLLMTGSSQTSCWMLQLGSFHLSLFHASGPLHPLIADFSLWSVAGWTKKQKKKIVKFVEMNSE